MRLSARVSTVLLCAFLALTLAIPFVYYLVVHPIFTAPNTFEDGLGYLESGRRLIATGSPYQDWQLAGPYGAVTPSDTYRYPPPFAQVAAVFAQAGADRLFIGILVAACFLAPLVLARSRIEVALALWLGLAFVPDWIAAWEAQVSGLLTIAIALALSEVPAAIWAGAALKVTPILALPAAILRMPRRVARAALVLSPILLVSVLVSPLAWAQFPTALVNGFLGGTDHASLAPSGLGRYGALLIVGLCMVGSLALARRSWPIALYLAVVAGLLGPGFLPNYALPVLLPFFFIAIRDEAARPYAFLAFLPLSVPFTSFAVPALLGMGVLGVAMTRLGSDAPKWLPGLHRMQNEGSSNL